MVDIIKTILDVINFILGLWILGSCLWYGTNWIKENSTMLLGFIIFFQLLGDYPKAKAAFLFLVQP